MMQTRTAEKLQPIMGRESLAELFGDLATESSALIRDEIELAKQEMNEKLTRLQKGAVLAIAGAWVGSFALMTLIAATVIALAKSVGLVESALIIGGALLVLAAILSVMGIGRLKQTSLKPEQTIETLQEDKEWLKELA